MRHVWPLAFLLLGCDAHISTPNLNVPTPGVKVHTPGVNVHGGAPPSAAVGQVAAAGPSCQGDAHCLLPNDLIVCENSWYCYAAHTLNQPTAQTKHQGQFLLIKSGKQIWTDRWFITRPLESGEKLSLTQPIVFFNSNSSGGVRMPPVSHERAIKGTWLTARVTDLSDLFKGVVHTNSRNVHVTAVRVIKSAGTQKVERDR